MPLLESTQHKSYSTFINKISHHWSDKLSFFYKKTHLYSHRTHI